MPTPTEQELLRENEFLKSRIQAQQKMIQNEDVVYLSQQNKLLKVKVQEMEEWTEQLLFQNSEQMMREEAISVSLKFEEAQTKIENSEEEV